MYRLVEHLLRASQDCGRVLRERQKRSLGHFVLDALEDVGPSAVGLVDGLVAAFPAQFRDEAEFEGEPVAFYKKAMLLASELHKRFAAEDPRFAAKVARVRRIEETDAAVAEWTSARTRDEAVAALRRWAACPVGPTPLLRHVN